MKGFKALLSKYLQRNSRRSQKLNLGNRFLVLGDSHVRSYANNPNFFPVFLGEGRLNNFTSNECAENYSGRAVNVLRHVGSGKVIFILGEPDTRYSLGLGWLPWDDVGSRNSMSSDIDGLVLSDSVVRISNFVEELEKKFPEFEFFVMSVFPVEMQSQNSQITSFNELLIEHLQDRVLDCRGHSKDLREHLVDPVHHSGGIQTSVEEILHSRRLIASRSGCSQEGWEPEEVRKMFKMNEKFGCFVCE